MDDIKVRLEEIDLNLKKIEELSPEELGAWGRFSNLAVADGSLSPRGKEIIAVALSVLAQCQWCIPFYVKRALELGARKQEIVESAWIAVMMGGSPALMFAQLVLEALEEFEEYETRARTMKSLEIELDDDLYKYLKFLEKMSFIRNKEEAVTKALTFFKKLSMYDWLPEIYRIEGHRIILMDREMLLGIFEFLTESETYRVGHLTALKRKVLTPEFREIDLANKDNWMIVLKGLENLGWGRFTHEGGEVIVDFLGVPIDFLRGYLETMFLMEFSVHHAMDGEVYVLTSTVRKAEVWR